MTAGDSEQNNAKESAESVDQAQENAAAGAENQDSLEQALQAAEAKAAEHWDQLLRTKAEMENLRRRTEKDLEAAHKFALERFLQELLPVKDSMELGMGAADDAVDVAKLKEGMDLTLKMLDTLLDKSGVKVVDPQKGEKLNPELHQAMSIQEDPDAETNTILTVMQKGYTLNERLVRPAMVIVAKAVAKEATKTSGEDNKPE